MTAWYEPLLKPKKAGDDEEKEAFVSDSDSRGIVSNIFISIALMVGAALVMALFYWAYQKERNLFVTIFASFMFAYALYVTIFVTILRSKFSSVAFRLILGSSAFVAFMTLMTLIFFAVKTSQKLRGSGSSSGYSGYSSPSPSVSPVVQDYIGNSDNM